MRDRRGAGIIAAGMGAERQSSIRSLAPASLALFAVVFLIVVVASLGGGDGDELVLGAVDGIASERRATANASGRASRSAAAARASTSSSRATIWRSIAEQTGVSLEELRALNPTLDPQGLVSGQRVRLPRVRWLKLVRRAPSPCAVRAGLPARAVRVAARGARRGRGRQSPPSGRT